MTYSILLVVEIPDLSNVENPQLWESCITNLAALARQNIEIQLLAVNALLITLGKSLSELAKAISAIGKFRYSYLILNEEMTLHEVSKKV